MLTRAIAPVEELPATDLSASRAHELVKAVATSAPRVAAMTRQELRAAWAHAISVERIPNSNPFAGKTVGGRLTARRARSRIERTARWARCCAGWLSRKPTAVRYAMPLN